jgi:hypothetical protein
MRNYTVFWYETYDGKINKMSKDFEDESKATWFANQIKRCYDWVTCMETKDSRGY